MFILYELPTVRYISSFAQRRLDLFLAEQSRQLKNNESMVSATTTTSFVNSPVSIKLIQMVEKSKSVLLNDHSTSSSSFFSSGSSNDSTTTTTTSTTNNSATTATNEGKVEKRLEATTTVEMSQLSTLTPLKLAIGRKYRIYI